MSVLISPPRLTFTAALVVVAVAVGACGSRPAVTTDTALALHDSSGVTIVENQKPAWSATDAWTVDTFTPRFDIGTEAGPAEYELHQVRAAVRLRDGRIAVANMGNNEIRFYDSTGKHLKSVGRSGQGPGEFEQLWRMKKISDDSLMALEPADLTSIFTGDGAYVRRFRLDPARGYTNLWWLGRFDSGHLLVFSLARIGTRELQHDPERKLGPDEEEARISIPEKPGGYRDSLMHFLYTMDGQLLDTIGRLPSQWVGDQIVFAPNAAYAFDGNRFYHSPGDRIEIREFTVTAPSRPAVPTVSLEPLPRPSVQLTRIVRVPAGRDLTVTKADTQRYLDAERARYKRTGRRSDAEIDRVLQRVRRPMAPRIPAHANRMYVDPQRALWIQDFNPDEDAGARWFVVDSSGTHLGVVVTPGRFMLTEIGEDYVLGVWRDPFDVEHVRMYTLHRKRTT